MATVKNETFDGEGNVIESQTVELPPELANYDTLRQRARAALAANRTYLALATPTAAQNTAQVNALTRQVQALIRFTLSDLTGTD